MRLIQAALACDRVVNTIMHGLREVATYARAMVDSSKLTIAVRKAPALLIFITFAIATPFIVNVVKPSLLDSPYTLAVTAVAIGLAVERACILTVFAH